MNHFYTVSAAVLACALMAAAPAWAERFDALAVRQQQLLRRLVLRHRSGQMAAMSE